MTSSNPHPQPAGPTPGPWTTETGLPHACRPRVYGADGSLVAEIGSVVIDQDRWEADAALIASAPETTAKCAALEARCATLTAEREALASRCARVEEALEQIADLTDVRADGHADIARAALAALNEGGA